MKTPKKRLGQKPEEKPSPDAPEQSSELAELIPEGGNKTDNLPVRRKGRGDFTPEQKLELASRFPTKGRPIGAKNKYTDLRDSFLEAFKKTGGTQALITWASSPRNKEAFYKMVVGLLPKHLDVEQHGAEAFSVNIIHYDGGGE